MALKLAIGVGIGLFITLVGLREGGIVVNDPATGIGLGDLTKGPPLIATAGILVAAVLVARKQRGAVILGVRRGDRSSASSSACSTDPTAWSTRRTRTSFSIIGEALDPDYLGDALTRGADPGHLRPLHDRLLRHHRHRGGRRPRRRHARRPRPAAQGRPAAAGRLERGGGRRRDGRLERHDVRRERRRRGRGRAHRSCLTRHRRPVPAHDVLRAARRARRAGRAARRELHPPRGRARAGDGRLPDDADRPRTSTGTRPRARSRRS